MNMGKREKRLLAWMICATLVFAESICMDFRVMAREEKPAERAIEIDADAVESEVGADEGEHNAEEEVPSQMVEPEIEDTEGEAAEDRTGTDISENDLQDAGSGTDGVEEEQEEPEEQQEAPAEDEAEIESEEGRISVMAAGSDFEWALNSSSTWYILKRYNGSNPIVIIPDSLNGKYVCEIASGAFYYSGDYINTVHMPAHLTTLSGQPFFGCGNLETIDVDPANTIFSSTDGVLYLVHKELVQCPQGKTGTVSIPDGVEEIGTRAFCMCTKLEKIVIPQSVTKVKSGAFSNCDQLSDIYYGGTAEQWQKLNVTGLSEKTKIHYGFVENDYQYIELADGTVEITGYSGSCDYIQIPAQLGGKRVTSIGERAFCNSSSSRSYISIPESITNIGSEAFAGCSWLQYIYYAGSEEQWKQITIQDSIEAEVYYHCIPDRYLYEEVEGGIEITGYTGKDLDIMIPNYIDGKRVLGLGADAFYQSGIQSVCLPQGMIYIGETAFAGCTSLQSVNIPDGVTSIGKYAFAVCSSLGSISLPESLTDLGEFAFNCCSALERIDFPKSVMDIRKRTFNECGNLKHIYYSGSRKQWKGVEIAEGNEVLSGAEVHYADDAEEIYFDCKVTFNAWGVADIPVQTVKEYDLIEKPQDPVRAEYSFVGWYYEDKKWDFEHNIVRGDMTLNAKWEAEEKVSVDASGTKKDGQGFEIWQNGSQAIFVSHPNYKGSSSGGYAKNSTTWSVDNSNVVTISSTSGDSIQVTAVSAGTAMVKERTVSQYYLNNALTGKIELQDTQIYEETRKLRVVDPVSTIHIQPEMELKLNQSAPVEYSTIPTGNYARFISGFQFKSSDKAVAVVSGDGIVTAMGVGTAVITAYTLNNSGSIACEAECMVTVKAPEETGGEDENTYTVEFRMNGHGEMLDEYFTYNKVKRGNVIKEPTKPQDPDYRFTGWYKEAGCVTLWNFATDTVEADVVLYAGWVKKDPGEEENNFGDVLPEDVPADEIIPNGIWAAGIMDKIYTACNVDQTFRLYDGTRLLKEKVDYTVSYKNNKLAYGYSDQDYAAFEQKLQETGKRKKTGDFDPNKAPQVVVKMKGNYSGSKIIYFRIRQADLSGDDFVAADLAATYSGKKQTPSPILLWKGKALKYGKDFFIPEYDAARNDSSAFSERGGIYDLTIAGKNNFTGEIPVKLTISAGDSQIALENVTVKGIGNYSWTGQQIRPDDYILKYKNKIISGADYTVSFGANTDVGTGTVTFTGTGADEDGDGYSCIGTKTVSFKIVGAAISKAVVSGIEKSYTYTGNVIEPEPRLRYKINKNTSPVTLTRDVHYKVSYQKNRDKGTATIVFTGMESGGYTGTKKYTFKITAGSLSDETIDDFCVNFKDTGNIQNGIYVAPYMKGGAKPEVIVKAYGRILESGKDYTVSYINNKKVARYTDMKAPALIIKGIGNYTGSQRICFSIAAKPLSNENGITVVANDKVESAKANGYRQNFKVYDADGKALGGGDCDFSHAVYTLVGTEETVLDRDSVVPAGSVVRITVQGKGPYAGGMATGTYRVLKAGCDISKATIQISPQSYTGRPVIITDQSQFKAGKVYVKNGRETKVLTLGQEIEVVSGSYINNINRGTAKVTFRGINGYGGLKTVTYKIGLRSIADFWKGIFH